MLLIRARGTARFRLLSHRVEQGGLLVGMAELIGSDVPLEGTHYMEKFGACAEVLERIIATIRERDAESLPFLEPFRLDDPTWVSNRLSEVLPIALKARQKLMELQDAGARIDIVHHYMQQHQLL
jgi:Lon protease-like protein